MTKPFIYSMAGVLQASAQRKFTVASMFCGGGGSSIGYALAGGHVLLAVDNSGEAVRTYKANFPATQVVKADIREIAATKDATLAFFGRAGIAPGQLDILDISAPCKAFSSLGPGITTGGTADLLFVSMKVARWMRPRVVVLENVKALAGKYVDILENALDDLRFDENGERVYFAAHKILTASEFGVPQKRPRMIAVAVRIDDAAAGGITSDDDVKRVFPELTTLEEPVTVRAAFEGLVQDKSDIEPWFTAMSTSPSARILPILNRDPQKFPDPKWIKPRHVGLGSASRYSLVRLDWDLPSPTLTASGQQPDSRCGVVHPVEPRKPSIPEQKRLHGFPDDYVCTGTLGQAAERLGNAVPPLLMRAIAQSVYEKILRPFHEAEAKSDSDASHQATKKKTAV